MASNHYAAIEECVEAVLASADPKKKAKYRSIGAEI
jgi:hypothetical protein